MAPFEHVTGIDVVYHGTDNMPREFASRVRKNRLPDIVELVRPDLLQALVRDGRLHDAADMVGMDWLEQHYDQRWIDLSKVEGVHAGVWYGAAPDGLVSYNRPVFDSEGYEVPRTWQEMLDLSDRMVSDGHTPWVISIGQGGWVAPIWLKHVMTRVHPPEVYDRWAAGDLPFDSSEVREAMRYLEEIWLNEDYVLGGTRVQRHLGALPPAAGRSGHGPCRAGRRHPAVRPGRSTRGPRRHALSTDRGTWGIVSKSDRYRAD